MKDLSGFLLGEDEDEQDAPYFGECPLCGEEHWIGRSRSVCDRCHDQAEREQDDWSTQSAKEKCDEQSARRDASASLARGVHFMTGFRHEARQL